MDKLLLIADDLTGALDSAAHFAKEGFKTEIFFRQPDEINVDLSSLNDCEIVIVDTETRHETPDNAYEIIKNLLLQTSSFGFTHYFKKTDSALRGNIAAELKAMLDYAKKDLHFIPAYPKMDRLTKNGYHYINGQRVSESIFGQDPFTPVKESFIPNILAGVRTILDGDERTEASDAIIVYDATSTQDIANILDVLKNEGRLNFIAGCAGLAEQLSKYLHFKSSNKAQMNFDGSTIVFSGSLNSVTYEQLKYANELGIAHYKLSEEAKKNIGYAESAEGIDFLGKVAEELAENKNVMISVGFDEVQENIPEEVREEVGLMLGKLAYKIIKNKPQSNLFIVGGDTVVSLMYQLEKPRIIPMQLLDEGIVISRLESEEMHLNLITKSGGFGSKTLITEVLKKLNTYEK